MDVVNLLISLFSGAVGGNLSGAALSEKNLGIIGNTIAGLVGGGLGDFILKAMGFLATTTAATGGIEGSGLDLSSLLANVGVSGVSGAALAAIIALIKNAVEKK